jgi:ketosteroid isomerase-like protein
MKTPRCQPRRISAGFARGRRVATASGMFDRMFDRALVAIGTGMLVCAGAFLTTSVLAAEPAQSAQTSSSTAAPARTSAALAELTRQVTEAERAFAKTMADRDHAAFTRFLSEEAVFFSGQTEALRGKEQVAKAWKPLYEKPAAPFSWEPEKVEVLDSGTLALSTGPVRSADGKHVGNFTSIWRLEAPGQWRIVFDKGCDVCTECAKP